MTDGLVTTVPTSVAEAKQMGMDLVHKKGGEMLSKVSGTNVYKYKLTRYETDTSASLNL